ncbi:MAG: hypothetical protein LBK03_08070, partial [Bacteroidales bacterium]|nr:hypothetical protein [Bacteroidales bacterium]
MKSYRVLLVFSLTTLILAGCGLKKMVSRYPEVKVYLENPDLETKGGKVDYTVKGTVPAKYMKKKATVTLTPTLQYDGKEYALDPIKLVGEKSTEAGVKMPYKAGGTFSKSGSFDYKPEYEEAEMVTKGVANLKKKSADLPPKNLASGISNTASRVGLSPELGDKTGNGTFLLYAPHDYKAESVAQTGVIYFALNQSDLNWNLNLNKK